jgi:hypothetical protein
MRDGYYGTEFRTAEKGGKGVALRISTRAKAFLKASIRLLDITEIRLLTSIIKCLIP